MLAFPCPHCSREVRAPAALAGRRVRCPHCGQALAVPQPTEGEPPRPCPLCGQPAPPGATLCTRCGTNLATGRRELTRVRGHLAHETEEVRSWVAGVSLLVPLAIVPYRSLGPARGSRRTNAGLLTITVGASLAALMVAPAGHPGVLRYALWSGRHYSPEQLLTHLLLHGGLGHLAMNMIFLWVFGGAANRALGGGKYLLAYAGLGALAGFCGHVLPAEPGADVPLVGASGAICGLTGLYLVLFPRHDLHLVAWVRPLWILTRPWIRTFPLMGLTAVLFFIAFDVAAVVLGWTGAVAHWVHLAGFLWGVTLGLALLLAGAVRTEGYDLLTWILGDRWRRTRAG